MFFRMGVGGYLLVINKNVSSYLNVPTTILGRLHCQGKAFSRIINKLYLVYIPIIFLF